MASRKINDQQDDQQSFIQRSPHDKKNPYVMVSNDLIRDDSISPTCRWLLIRFLSNDDRGWKINVAQVVAELKKYLGRDKIYALLTEAIEAGYIRREQERVGNRLGNVTYFISEFPIFKKSLLLPDSQLPDSQLPENPHIKKEQSSSSEEEKKKQVKEKSPLVAPPSAAASDLTQDFISKLRERSPRTKVSSVGKWVADMGVLLSNDGRDVDEVRRLIAWISQDTFWRRTCLSVDSLRRNYDKIFLSWEASVESAVVADNRNWALALKKQHAEHLKDLTYDERFVYNRLKGKELPFSLPSVTFRQGFVALFGGSL